MDSAIRQIYLRDNDVTSWSWEQEDFLNSEPLKSILAPIRMIFVSENGITHETLMPFWQKLGITVKTWNLLVAAGEDLCFLFFPDQHSNNILCQRLYKDQGRFTIYQHRIPGPEEEATIEDLEEFENLDKPDLEKFGHLLELITERTISLPMQLRLVRAVLYFK